MPLACPRAVSAVARGASSIRSASSPCNGCAGLAPTGASRARATTRQVHVRRMLRSEARWRANCTGARAAAMTSWTSVPSAPDAVRQGARQLPTVQVSLVTGIASSHGAGHAGTAHRTAVASPATVPSGQIPSVLSWRQDRGDLVPMGRGEPWGEMRGERQWTN